MAKLEDYACDWWLDHSHVIRNLLRFFLCFLFATSAALTHSAAEKIPVVCFSNYVIFGIVFTTSFVLSLSFTRIARDRRELKKLNEQQQQLLIKDSLTELHNENFVPEAMEMLFNLAIREATESERSYLICIMIDADNFKKINDRLGHPIGDIFIQQIATRISSCARSCDFVIRLHGDEFQILAVTSDPKDFYERAFSMFAEFEVKYGIDERGKDLTETVRLSSGYAQYKVPRNYPREKVSKSLIMKIYKGLYTEADAYLYQMKMEKGMQQ